MMVRFIFAAAVVYLMLGIGRMVNEGGSYAAIARSTVCRLPAGWHSLTGNRKFKYLLFGEIHGTREAPALIGSVACALAERGKKVLVGVELSAVDDVNIQRAWKGPIGTFRASLSASGWAGRADGVASEAMMKMLEDIHALKVAGNAVEIVAFNGPKDAAQADQFSNLPLDERHEAIQAQNILDAAASQQFDYVLILVGEAHARHTPIIHGDTNYRSMAMFLAQGNDVLSLKMATAGGTAWNCTLRSGFKPAVGQPVTAQMVECANHSLGDLPADSMGPRVGIGLPPNKVDNVGFDGYFWLPRVSGSPPAVL